MIFKQTTSQMILWNLFNHYQEKVVIAKNWIFLAAQVIVSVLNP